MAFQVLAGRPVVGLIGEPELGALKLVVDLPVVVLGREAGAHPEAVVRGDGDVAPVEQPVEVGAEEEPVSDVMRSASKESFYVFDFCGNFDFFEEYPDGVTSRPPPPMRALLFERRLRLAAKLAEEGGSEDLKMSILDELHAQVRGLNTENFLVRPHRMLAEVFSDRAEWDRLTHEDRLDLTDKLAALPSESEESDEHARRFDLLILSAQLALVEEQNTFEGIQGRIRDVAASLEAKANVPMVQAELDLIQDLQSDRFWEGVTPEILEDVRRRLRGLAQFVDARGREIIYTNFKDEVTAIREATVPGYAQGEGLARYRRKVEAFVRAHQNHLTVHKLQTNRPLTQGDLDELERLLFTAEGAESLERFEKAYPDRQPLGVFVRRLVGLDRGEAKRAFADYLEDGAYSADQLQFIDHVVDHLTQNGTMDPGLLYEPPFTNRHPNGLDGTFADADADRIVSIVRSINDNAAPRDAA